MAAPTHVATATMDALVWTAPKTMEMQEVPVPAPDDDELLLEAVHNAVRAHVRTRERDSAGREARERAATLSVREREVLALVVAGLTNKEIGRALGLSPRTVETHRVHLSHKLQVESLAQMIRQYAALVDEAGTA